MLGRTLVIVASLMLSTGAHAQEVLTLDKVVRNERVDFDGLSGSYSMTAAVNGQPKSLETQALIGVYCEKANDVIWFSFADDKFTKQYGSVFVYKSKEDQASGKVPSVIGSFVSTTGGDGKPMRVFRFSNSLLDVLEQLYDHGSVVFAVNDPDTGDDSAIIVANVKNPNVIDDIGHMHLICQTAIAAG